MSIKFARYILYSIVGIFAITVGLVSYWEYQSTDVLDIKNPITVEPPIASSGNPIVLTLNYCKNYSASGSVRISFVGDAIEIFQPMATDSQPKGCYKDIKAPILLPPATVVPAGTYRIKFNVNYQINPIKTVHKVFYTEKFTIE